MVSEMQLVLSKKELKFRLIENGENERMSERGREDEN